MDKNERVAPKPEGERSVKKVLLNVLKKMRERARGEDEFSFVDFNNFSEVGQFLDKYDVQNSGDFAFIMRSKNDPDFCIRIPFTNILGSRWLKEYLQKRRESFPGDLQIAFAVSHVPKVERKDRIKMAGERLLEKARSHNAFYVADPSSTVPINVVYRFKGEPFGYGMKFLEGDELEIIDDLSFQEIDKLRKYTGHLKARNMLRVNPRSSPHSLQIIDINPPGEEPWG